MKSKHKVVITKCDRYDPEKIARIVQKGMEILGVTPRGQILLKPNGVIAHPDLFPYAFTRKEFLDGVLSAVKQRAADVKRISVGERSGITIPTRFIFKNAGWDGVVKKHGVRAAYFDEVPQVPVKLNAKDALRKQVFIPKPVVDADFLINLPKFKAHPWCRLTLSLKNFIGIQDDRHRLVDHNLFLEHKIADLQEVIQPGFIAIDAITAGQRMMLTPTPFHMGAIVMGTNSCAVDTVGCHMVGVDPFDLIHLRLAAQRGLGPMHLEEIEIVGDFPLDEVKARTRDFEFCLERVDHYFPAGSGLRCTVGTFPEKHSRDYCWGGCPGALQEAMHIFRAYDPHVDKKMGKVRYVVGHVSNELDLDEDEKVLFVGNCTRYKGKVHGEVVDIRPEYKQPCEVDETRTPSNDMLLKTFKTIWDCFKNRNKKFLHARGCTVSVGDHVHYLSFLTGMPNINFDPRMVVPVNIAYFQMRLKRLLNRILGR
jgi:uncharacterized protein (DUF362 family)